MFTRYMYCKTFSLKTYPMSNFEAVHCGVNCSISTLLSNRVNLLSHWSLVEETIRYLNLLEISYKKTK